LTDIATVTKGVGLSKRWISWWFGFTSCKVNESYHEDCYV